MPGERAPRSAALASGGHYGAEGPLLMYAKVAVERRGGLARAVNWQRPAAGDSPSSASGWQPRSRRPWTKWRRPEPRQWWSANRWGRWILV